MNASQKTFFDSKVEIQKRVSERKITCPGAISLWEFHSQLILEEK